jgi:hypothetical protein
MTVLDFGFGTMRHFTRHQLLRLGAPGMQRALQSWNR